MADNEELKEKYEALKLENQEGYEIVAELKHECEQKEKELKELKRQYKLSCLDCEYKNTKADVERYRKECDFWKHQAELGSETTDRLAKQLEEKEQECEELKKANQHIDANRQRKGSKLKRIEELISACETGYTDEFIQKIYGIIQESEPAIDDYSITDRYRKALDEIENYINSQGIDNKWNMYIQRFRSGILNIIKKAKGEGNDT